MRKVMITLLLTCLPGYATAQTTAWADKLFAGDLVHDFGTVARGAQLKYSFKMTNIYKVPLEITNIRATCSCVTIKESTKIIQPNETGFIHVNMNTAIGNAGKKDIKVYITVGPEYISTATLAVQANVRADVTFNPGEIDFGTVAHGQNPTKFIDVEYAGTFPWSLSEIVKNGTAPFELDYKEIKNKSIRGYRILATMKAEAQPGDFKQEVMLKTNDPSNPILTFNVVGKVQATLTVTPDFVKLTGAKVGDSATKKVMVRGSRPFRVLAVDGQGDGLTAVYPEREEQLQIVEIRFQPAREGEMKKDLIIRTNLNNEQVIVRVEGNGS